VTPDEGFTLTQVQQYAPDPATGSRRLVRERHYVRLRPAPHAPPVYVQSGQCWSESGDVIDPVPDGVLVQLQAITRSVRAACGWPGDPPTILESVLFDAEPLRCDTSFIGSCLPCAGMHPAYFPTRTAGSGDVSAAGQPR